MFEAAADAVAYAMAYQRAVAKLNPPLKARAGVHVGPHSAREQPVGRGARAKPLEVEGTAKAVAARVMSIANGGADPSARRCAKTPSGKSSCESSRTDTGSNEKALQTDGDCSSRRGYTLFMPPPDAVRAIVLFATVTLLPTRNTKHSLPAELDSFVGRRETLAELGAPALTPACALYRCGIVHGKTRLITRFGWSWLGDFRGGVCSAILSRPEAWTASSRRRRGARRSAGQGRSGHCSS